MSMKFQLISELLCHEQVRPLHVSRVKRAIEASGAWLVPVCIDRDSGLLIDGHHRLMAAIKLGLSRIPCYIVDYQQVALSWGRSRYRTDKQAIIERARQGRLYPPKTTRHKLNLPRLAVPVPLDALR